VGLCCGYGKAVGGDIPTWFAGWMADACSHEHCEGHVCGLVGRRWVNMIGVLNLIIVKSDPNSTSSKSDRSPYRFVTEENANDTVTTQNELC
jgi:hypothetical protein